MFALPLSSFPISSSVKLLSLVCSPFVLWNPLVLVLTPCDWLLTLSEMTMFTKGRLKKIYQKAGQTVSICPHQLHLLVKQVLQLLLHHLPVHALLGSDLLLGQSFGTDSGWTEGHFETENSEQIGILLEVSPSTNTLPKKAEETSSWKYKTTTRYMIGVPSSYITTVPDLSPSSI